MNTIALKTTLAALVVATPLSGAFADNVRGELPEFLKSPIDRTYTSSIGSSTRDMSLAGQLDIRITAVQANLKPDRDGLVDQATASRVLVELHAIRQAAAAEARANGGDLSAASFESLSTQLNALQRAVY